MADKCFCHLNGVAVKDATARKEITKLYSEIEAIKKVLTGGTLPDVPPSGGEGTGNCSIITVVNNSAYVKSIGYFTPDMVQNTVELESGATGTYYVHPSTVMSFNYIVPGELDTTLSGTREIVNNGEYVNTHIECTVSGTITINPTVGSGVTIYNRTDSDIKGFYKPKVNNNASLFIDDNSEGNKSCAIPGWITIYTSEKIKTDNTYEPVDGGYIVWLTKPSDITVYERNSTSVEHTLTIVNNTPETELYCEEQDTGATLILGSGETGELVVPNASRVMIYGFNIYNANYYVYSGDFADYELTATEITFNNITDDGTITISKPTSGDEPGGSGGNGVPDTYGTTTIAITNNSGSGQNIAYMTSPTQSVQETIPTGTTKNLTVYAPSLISFYQTLPYELTTSLEVTKEIVGDGTFITSYVKADATVTGATITIGQNSNGAVHITNYESVPVELSYKPVDGMSSDDRYDSINVEPNETRTIVVQTPGWVTVLGNYPIVTNYPTERVPNSSNTIVYVRAGVNSEQSIVIGDIGECVHPKDSCTYDYSDVENHTVTCGVCGKTFQEGHTWINHEPCVCGATSHYTSNGDGTHNWYVNGELRSTEECTFSRNGYCVVCGYEPSEEKTYTCTNPDCAEEFPNAGVTYAPIPGGTHDIDCDECGQNITNESCTFVDGVCVYCGQSE